MVFNKVHTVQDSVHSVSMRTQVGTLLCRRVTLIGRDTNQLKMRLGMSILQGVIIGVAFWDIAKKLPAQQISFLFLMLQVVAISVYVYE